jgi:hypothetical protein
MASNIVTTQINVNYPVAGQDNDTQGFRTNFQNIQTALNTAAYEISALQSSTASFPIISTVDKIVNYSVGAGNIAFDNGNLYVTTSPSNYLKIPTASQLYSNANVSGYLPNYTGNITAAKITLTSAIQFANLTTTQINAISSPARGMTVYNYTSGNIQVYNGTKWANVTLS